MFIYLSVTLLVIPSPILMIISSEAIAIILSLKGFSAILIALSLAVGQSIGFSLLYFFSDAICERWDKLQKGLARLDLEKLKNRAWPLLGCASFFGFPPQTPIGSARLAKEIRSVARRQGRRGQILHSA